MDPLSLHTMLSMAGNGPASIHQNVNSTMSASNNAQAYGIAGRMDISNHSASQHLTLHRQSDGSSIGSDNSMMRKLVNGDMAHTKNGVTEIFHKNAQGVWNSPTRSITNTLHNDSIIKTQLGPHY